MDNYTTSFIKKNDKIIQHSNEEHNKDEDPNINNEEEEENDDEDNEDNEDDEEDDENINNVFENLKELLLIFSSKIQNIEFIEDASVKKINDILKFLKINHNKKLHKWYNKQYYQNLKEFKINNTNYNEVVKLYEDNSLIIIKKN